MIHERTPLVSFIVPCYKLAHLLGECVRSILDQTFEDFEVLIMDDCSPDATPEVARSFSDDRVQHVRHPRNIGHLENYYAGIKRSRGRYIWLISADDRLRSPHVLARFVAALEARPSATYVFCPAMTFDENGERGVYGSIGVEDRVMAPGEFTVVLLDGNIVCAPAVLARRDAYETAAPFPFDLPFAGDWYVWAAFSMQGDVVYLAEPMVDRRLHALNMTKSFLDRAPAVVRDELEVRWRIKALACARGDVHLHTHAVQSLANDYALRVGRRAADDWPYGLTVDQFEASLDRHAPNREERATIRAVTYAALGDAYLDRGRPDLARGAYKQALAARPASLRTLSKLVLLCSGRARDYVRDAAAMVKRRMKAIDPR